MLMFILEEVAMDLIAIEEDVKDRKKDMSVWR